MKEFTFGTKLPHVVEAKSPAEAIAKLGPQAADSLLIFADALVNDFKNACAPAERREHPESPHLTLDELGIVVHDFYDRLIERLTERRSSMCSECHCTSEQEEHGEVLQPFAPRLSSYPAWALQGPTGVSLVHGGWAARRAVETSQPSPSPEAKLGSASPTKR